MTYMRSAPGWKAAARRAVLIGLIALSCWIFQGSAYAQKAITPEQETFTNLELTLPPPGSKERFYQSVAGRICRRPTMRAITRKPTRMPTSCYRRRIGIAATGITATRSSTAIRRWD